MSGRRGKSEGPVGPETFFSSRGQARAIKRNETASVSLALSHSSSCFCSPPPLRLAPRGMARLFSMRQFNDATQPRQIGRAHV